MALKKLVYPAWVDSSVRAELEPGEEHELMADFSQPVPNQKVSRTFVLTNRYLRCMAFKSSLFGGSKPRPVVWSYALRFEQISSFGEQRQNGLFVTEMRGMVFTAPTGQEVWWTQWGVGGELIDRLRMVAGRPVPSIGLADELAKLAALRGDGVLTEEEFARGKEAFLGQSPDETDRAMQTLRQLHSLHVAGVLSQSEFNTKKWDVLSRR